MLTLKKSYFTIKIKFINVVYYRLKEIYSISKDLQ